MLATGERNDDSRYPCAQCSSSRSKPAFAPRRADTLFGELARLTPGEPETIARPDADAVILFTSGTSAKPKGVVLNFREFLSNIDPLGEGFGITADDRLVLFPSL